MKTLQMACTIGVNPNYNHGNEIQNPVAYVEKIWMKIARDLQKETMIFIPVTATAAKTFYLEEWGCPKGGEDVVMLTSVCNSEFVRNLDAWKETVIKACSALGKELNQKTVYLTFSEVEFHYLVRG